ncbi:NAD(P)/FAD-dependent oxidoreductase [Parvibaculum sp.]|uniref:NAD(P)/FAD-dependent oxidoreductase n=1 Tax=Parvibaculum sp. TaxID=2024848 RepID=UPI00320FE350
MSPIEVPLDETALAELAREELALLSYPERRWVKPYFDAGGRRLYDVVIVGGGQSGLVIAHSLIRQGVDNILVLDRSPEGYEGVWETVARMSHLRTPKALCGMELGQPSLSLQRWYMARHGREAWEALDRVPRRDWMEYLRWYRKTLNLPIVNDTEVETVEPEADHILVTARRSGARETFPARLVVLATGFDGAGRWSVPEVISDNLPPTLYSHSNVEIDFAALAGKRIGILGHAASAFDTATAVLNAGAASADICFRRPALPTVNPHRHLETAAFLANFPELSDATRWQIARHFRQVDQPPAHSGFFAATALPGFRMHAASPWLDVRQEGDAIRVKTPRGEHVFDYLIAATGYTVDYAARPELSALAPHVLRWKDRYTPPAGAEHALLGDFPYLGLSYEYLQREPGTAPWVERIFAFNFSGTVSMGPHSTSISGHRYALPRLIRGVVRRLFLEQEEHIIPDLIAYKDIDLVIPPHLRQMATAAE